jgi:hypothetical protein
LLVTADVGQRQPHWFAVGNDVGSAVAVPRRRPVLGAHSTEFAFFVGIGGVIVVVDEVD